MPAPRLPPIDFRRLQRSSNTEAEAQIWYLLRDRRLGAKFRRQATAGPYTLDFFCSPLRLAVELDGFQHREEAGLDRDERRDAALAAAGIEVLRFTNEAAILATDAVAQEIVGAVERLTAARPKPPAGSGRRRDRLPTP